MDVEYMLSRAKRYQFLSTLFRDEIPLALIKRMQKDAFLDGFNESVKGCGFIDLINGAEVMTRCLKGKTAEEIFNELRYDYADIFLNVGPNPVFPYESVHVKREPVVMQEPVVELREYFRKAGVHKNPEYCDLEEHIAVQMELLRYLLEKRDEALYRDFFKNKYTKWISSFCDQLVACTKTDFYQGLAHFTRGAMMCESMRLEGFTRGEEVTRKMVGACEALELDPAYFTLSEGVVDPEPAKTVPSHCYACGALCGNLAKLKDGILTGVSGLEGDPKSGGRLCPKGAAAPKHV
jgi:TorA maturation chaperone TorD